MALLIEHPWVDPFPRCGPVTPSKFRNDSPQTLRPFGVKLADICRRRCSSQMLGVGKPSFCWTASRYKVFLENYSHFPLIVVGLDSMHFMCTRGLGFSSENQAWVPRKPSCNQVRVPLDEPLAPSRMM